MDQLPYLTRRIREDIDDYRAGKFSFTNLVVDTETCISAMMGHADQGWVEEWRSLWGQLEIVNAVMINEKRDAQSSEEAAVVAETLDLMHPMTSAFEEHRRDQGV